MNLGMDANGWHASLRPFLTVFQSYQDDGRLIMKGCVQWNSIYGREDFASSGDRTWSARSEGQRLTHWAIRAPMIFRCPNTEAHQGTGIYTVQILSNGTDRSQQTVQTKIRLLLKKQSDQGLRCLPFHQYLLDALIQCYIELFYY